MGACEHRGQMIELFGHARYVPLRAEHCPVCMAAGDEPALGRSAVIQEALRCRAELVDHSLRPDDLPAIRAGVTLYAATRAAFMAATQAHRLALPSSVDTRSPSQVGDRQ